jgi:hypothetical protein
VQHAQISAVPVLHGRLDKLMLNSKITPCLLQVAIATIHLALFKTKKYGLKIKFSLFSIQLPETVLARNPRFVV